MKRPVAAVALLAALALTGCSTGPDGDGRASVVAAFYPLEYVAERVAGGRVDVEGLTPPGVEPHDLELSSSQVRALLEADLVVYLGEGFQPAVEDAISDLEDGARLDALAGRELLEGDEAHEDEEEPGSEEHGGDPHVWLDPTILAAIGQEVAARLGNLDPGNADLFAANAERLTADLETLDQAYSDGLARCAARELVTSHAAFGYLAARYDLEQVSVSGIDPDAEPSPQRLAEVASFVAENDVKVVFFEELVSPDLAATLARETGARTDVLSPLETRPDTGDYLTEMRRNLDRLRSALGCD